MKVVRITKRMLNLTPGELLLTLGACNKEKTLAYPWHVYFSNQDYNQLKKNTRAVIRAASPYYSKRYIDTQLGYEMLNYGPNTSYAEGVKPGYALVDYDGIEKEKKNGRSL